MKTNDINNEVDESVTGMMKLTTLLAFLAIPSIMPASAIAENLPKKNNITAADVRTAMDKATQDSKTYGGFNSSNAVNIIARTLWGEARGESEAGKKAVASVLWNRAGQKAENLPKVALRRKQFSCWNSTSMNDRKPENYSYVIPNAARKNPIDKKSWQACLDIAAQLIKGTFKSTVGNANAYYVSNMSNPPAWDADLTGTQNVGSHKFGYLKEHDPNRKSVKAPERKTYIVKKNDYFGKIAKTLNIKIRDLQKMNPQIKNINKIKPGDAIYYIEQ